MNAERVFKALRDFGAPLQNIQIQDFAEPDVFYQIGIAPVGVDVMTSVSGLDFAAAWERRKVVDFDSESAPVLSREDLLASKVAAGRGTDRKHIRSLQKRKG